MIVFREIMSVIAIYAKMRLDLNDKGVPRIECLECSRVGESRNVILLC